MGMMTRRNVKARGAVAPQPVPKVVEKKEVTLEEKVKASGLMKTEINRMSTAELQEVANGFGIKDADEMSGNQIKKALIGALED
jgi:hypothetical protein